MAEKELPSHSIQIESHHVQRRTEMNNKHGDQDRGVCREAETEAGGGAGRRPREQQTDHAECRSKLRTGVANINVSPSGCDSVGNRINTQAKLFPLWASTMPIAVDSNARGSTPPHSTKPARWP